MSDLVGKSGPSKEAVSLANVVRLTRDIAADRVDAAFELQEMRRLRLEMLAEELAPVFADVPSDDPQFDFVLSSGLQPRLWIDATAHVTMARDGRTYRFLRDSRLGRTVIVETDKVPVVLEAVTRHIAERMVERQRMLDGVPERVFEGPQPDYDRSSAPAGRFAAMGEYVSGLLLVVFGAIAGIAILLVILSDLVPELGI